MACVVVVGSQWGDEGKGKVVDLLTERADIVARFQGGNNAGHTVVFSGQTYILHLIPSGIFHPGKLNVLGNGVVVDPEALIEEIDGLAKLGVEVGDNFKVSDEANLIMPYHKAMDRLRESLKGEGKIGTTGRGIGPAYVDKTGRVGIRIGDLLDEAYLGERLNAVVKSKNQLLTNVYGVDPIDPAQLYKKCLEFGAKLRPYVASVEEHVGDALKRGERVVLEGAQGAMLDLNHGTYPYVTS
ncbi:MAG: adenylosuccinate synthetase, partial [SAR324 cluster bacterium]|nr:adenylosuccinate synthetase [SAR324 cluster bacterium]